MCVRCIVSWYKLTVASLCVRVLFTLRAARVDSCLSVCQGLVHTARCQDLIALSVDTSWQLSLGVSGSCLLLCVSGSCSHCALPGSRGRRSQLERDADEAGRVQSRLQRDVVNGRLLRSRLPTSTQTASVCQILWPARYICTEHSSTDNSVWLVGTVCAYIISTAAAGVTHIAAVFLDAERRPMLCGAGCCSGACIADSVPWDLVA